MPQGVSLLPDTADEESSHTPIVGQLLQQMALTCNCGCEITSSKSEREIHYQS